LKKIVKVIGMSNEFIKEKILTLAEATEISRSLKEQGKKLVTVNGSFDLLHGGHVYFLSEAKRQGDLLFVGINSDKSIKQGKGEDRPILAEDERVALVASLVYVDYAMIVEAPYNKVQDVLLETVRPHIHVNGAEYGKPQEWIEWPIMERLGVEGYTIKRQPGFSTTDIIGKILKSKKV